MLSARPRGKVSRSEIGGSLLSTPVCKFVFYERQMGDFRVRRALGAMSRYVWRQAVHSRHQAHQVNESSGSSVIWNRYSGNPRRCMRSA